MAYGRRDPRKTLAAIDQLLENEVNEIPFDHACAEQFAKKVAELRRFGVEVGTADMMIGAVALLHNLTVVTHNSADFRRITGLRLEDWLTP